MANIMLTDACNLRCPYCFANEFVNHGVNEISEKNFHKALDFVATANDPYMKLGLIGGEPTIHSRFREILHFLIQDTRFANVYVFTNGIRIGEFLTELSHPKFHLLVNCNSPEDIGQKNFQKLRDNLDLFILKHGKKERITLGINLYGTKLRYDYLLALLKRYEYEHVRMAIAVPNTDACRAMTVRTYFERIKPDFMRFLHEMLSGGILPTYDCNKMPSCLMDPDEKRDIQEAIDGLQKRRALCGKLPLPLPLHDYAIYTDAAKCVPAIDIRQDLTAVRCFGLSAHSKVSISRFADIHALRRYYETEIDSKAYTVQSESSCSDCKLEREAACMGGCMAFKIDRILGK